MLAVLLADNFDRKADLALLGKLDRVGQQVTQYLTQELLGAMLTCGQPRIDVIFKRAGVGKRPGFEQGQNFVAQLAQGEIDRLRMAFAFFQAREVQHLVKNGE
ncbi:hypothetical protein D3C77_699150 [compost metagenome]